MNWYTKLTGYTITSANDAPSRIPRTWQLKGWDNKTDQWATLHTVKDNPEWDSRFKIKVWTFEICDQIEYLSIPYFQGANLPYKIQD